MGNFELKAALLTTIDQSGNFLFRVTFLFFSQILQDFAIATINAKSSKPYDLLRILKLFIFTTILTNLQ